MVDLKDFNTQEEIDLREFSEQGQKEPLLNEASNKSMASKGAALSGQDLALQNYEQISRELEVGPRSETLDNILRAGDDLNRASDLKSLETLLLDPNTTPDQKAQYVDVYNRIKVGKKGLDGINVNLAQAAIVEGGDEGQGVEADNSFLDLAPTLDEVDEYNGYVNSEAQAIQNSADQDWADKTGDFIELIIPFMEAGAVEKLKHQIGLGTPEGIIKGLSLLGENKQQIREAISKMPIEQRRQVAEYIIGNIKSSKGSLSPRENTMIQLSELNDFLISGSYSDGQRLADNIFSLLDTTVILSPLAKGFKNFGKTVAKASRAGRITAQEAQTARRSQEALARIEKEGIDIEVQTILKEYEEMSNAPASNISRGEAERATKETLERFWLRHIPEELKEEVGLVVDEALKKYPNTPSSEVLSPEIISGVKSLLEREGLKAIDKEVFEESTRIINENLNRSSARRMASRTNVDHTSISQIYKDTNPKKARDFHTAMVEDTSGEVAKVGYGTTRVEAVANDVLPEIAGPAGTVRHKVSFDEAAPNANAEVISKIKERGDIHFSANEKASMRSAVKADFDNVKGVNPRTEMSSVEDVPTGALFKMVYGPRDGGFSNGQVAKEQILSGLRKWGVTEDDVEVLVRNEQGLFEPTTDLNEKGVYLARVNYRYEFSPADVVSHSLTSSDKFFKMFDSLTPMTSGRAGSAAEHVIPHTVTTDPLLLNAASVAADKQSRIARVMLDQAKEYSQKLKALPSDQQERVNRYILEANNKGLQFNRQKLKLRGLNEQAIDTVKSWKDVNDTLWFLENQDLNKSLRTKGFERFISQSTQTDLIVKRVSDFEVKDGVRAYDPETDSVRSLDAGEIEKLLEEGGGVYKPRDKDFKVGEEDVDFLVATNKGTTSYARRIRDDDQTLNYRHGHYTVRYKTPYFIEKTVRRSGGGEVKVVVSTSGSRKAADAELVRLRGIEGEGAEYGVRGDLKKKTDAFDEATWGEASVRGRTSQKVRGERLKDVSHNQNDLEQAHIETPDESLVKSITSLANRVSHRDFIESAKGRFINQYKHLLKEQRGQTMWPDDVRAIGKGNIEASSSELADARDAWRYINMIENGYTNLIDDTTKIFFNDMANTAGRKGWGWLEGAARKGEAVTVVGGARKAAFKLLLAANPLRQLPVQSMQALPTILATNPKMLITPKLPTQMMMVQAQRMGTSYNSIKSSGWSKLAGMSDKEVDDMLDAYRAFGMEDAVQAHSLIRDEIQSLVAHTPFQKAKEVAGRPINVMQKVGFEAGETLLMRSVWLTEYDLLRRSGKKIDAESLSQLQARVRHLTLNMNRAGELPYNENLFSATMQFFQAPHKAFSQILMGHRGLTGSDRLRLGAAYVATYGIGGGFLIDQVRKLVPEHMVEPVENGLFNIMMNNALGSIYGEEVGIDFSDSLRLLEFPNFYKAFLGVMEGGVGELLADNPSASLVFGQNPRVTTFIKSLARPFTPQRQGTVDEMNNIARNALKMMSGGSNYFKATYILKTGQSMSSTGRIVDRDVNFVEGLAKFAGFSTLDEIKSYSMDEKLYKASQKPYEDIKLMVKEVSMVLANKDMSNEDADFYLEALAQLQVVFENDPFYMKIVSDELLRKAGKNEFEIFNRVMKLLPFSDRKSVEEIIQNSTMTDSEKATLRQTMDMMETQ